MTASTAPAVSLLRRPIIGVRAGVTALAVALAVVVALAVLVVSVAAGDGAPDRDRLRAEAGRLVAEVFSVDAAGWKGKRATVTTLVTDDFAAAYGTLLQGPPQSGVRSVVWRPAASSVVGAGRDWGETLTVFDVVTTPESGAATTGTRTMWVRLTRSSGSWRLARAEAVS